MHNLAACKTANCVRLFTAKKVDSHGRQKTLEDSGFWQ